MKLIVGLGNPGSKYAGTRHNIGYEVIHYLAAAPGVGGFRNLFQSAVAEVLEAGEKLLLMKPETFMNLSGRAVRGAVDFYKLTTADVMVICDDINLPHGKLRVGPTGATAGKTACGTSKKCWEPISIRVCGSGSGNRGRARRSITFSAGSNPGNAGRSMMRLPRPPRASCFGCGKVCPPA